MISSCYSDGNSLQIASHSMKAQKSILLFTDTEEPASFSWDHFYQTAVPEEEVLSPITLSVNVIITGIIS